MFNLHTKIIKAFTSLTCVDSISHEYPDYFEITLSNGIVIDLGMMDDENGYGWNTQIDDEIGITRELDPAALALTFSRWVKNTYYHKCQTCMKRSTN